MTTQRWKANHQVSLLPKSLHRRLLRPTFSLVHRAIHWTIWYQYSEEMEEGERCQCQPRHILDLVLLEGRGWVLDLVGCLCHLCRLHRTQLFRQSRLHNSLRTICWGCSRLFCVSFSLLQITYYVFCLCFIVFSWHFFLSKVADPGACALHNCNMATDICCPLYMLIGKSDT